MRPRDLLMPLVGLSLSVASCADGEVRQPPAVCARPDLGISIGDTLFGLSDAEIQARLKQAATLGACIVRIDFDMSQVKPTQGEQDWSQLDTIVETAQGTNLEVLGLVSYTPEWLRKEDCEDGQVCPPSNYDEFAAFAGAAASRYPDITKFEIWNEPNISRFDPKEYAEMFYRAARAIHNAHPDALVALGGLAPSPTEGTNYSPADYLQAVLAQLTPEQLTEINAIADHPYTAPVGPAFADEQNAFGQIENSNGLDIVSLVDVLQSYKLGGIAMWLTEFGAATGGEGAEVVSEADQAKILSEYLLWNFKTANVTMRLVYNLRDRELSSAADAHNPEFYFGLTDVDGTPKPAAEVFSRVALDPTK